MCHLLWRWKLLFLSWKRCFFFPIWWAVLLSRLTTARRYVTQAEWCRNDSNSAAHVWYFICWSCFQRCDVCTNICFLTEKCTCFCAAIRFCSACALSLCQDLWNRPRKNVRRYFHVCILGFGLKAAGSCWMQTWTGGSWTFQHVRVSPGFSESRSSLNLGWAVQKFPTILMGELDQLRNLIGSESNNAH